MKRILKFTALIFIIAAISITSCKKNDHEFKLKEVPVSRAGNDQIIAFPTDSVSLDGGASNDADGSIEHYLWTKISGPGTFLIVNPEGVKTLVKKLVRGVYRFELKVTDDSGLFAKDTVQVIVSDSVINTTLISIGKLSQGRLAPTAAAAGNKVLFAGGVTVDSGNYITGVHATVDIYDFTSNSWSTAELSQARFAMSVASAGSKILFAGGTTVGGIPSTRIDIYDIVSNTWSKAELSQSSSGYVPAAGAGNKAVFDAVMIDNGRTTTTVNIYDAASDSWSTVDPGGERGGNSAVISSGHKIFFAGGGDIDPWSYWGNSGRIDIYDVDSDTWSSATLSQQRGGIAAGVAGNKIVFAGGWHANAPSDKVDIFDIETNTWSATTLSEGRSIDVVTAVGNKVFFGSSFGGSYSYSNRVDIYDATTGNWSEEKLDWFNYQNPDNIGVLLGAEASRNHAVFFQANLPHLIIYDAVSGKWGLSAQITPLNWEAAFVAANDQIFIANREGVWRVEF